MERSSGAAPPRHSGGSGQTGGSPGELLSVGIETNGRRSSVVSLSGELDLSTVPQIGDRILEELRAQGAVVVDLTQLSFIDSTGIAVLIQAFRAAGDTCRMHTVIAPGSQVERVFRLAGIDRALPLFFDRAGALAAL